VCAHKYLSISYLYTAYTRKLCFSVKMPPSIAVHPLKDKIFRVDDDVTLECVAQGVPTPR